MKRLHSYIELEVDKRKLPGCYFLLAHPDSSLRAWAVKLVNQMGTLTLPDYKDFIKPIFASWYQVSFTCRPPKDKGLVLSMVWYGMVSSSLIVLLVMWWQALEETYLGEQQGGGGQYRTGSNLDVMLKQ